MLQFMRDVALRRSGSRLTGKIQGRSSWSTPATARLYRPRWFSSSWKICSSTNIRWRWLTTWSSTLRIRQLLTSSSSTSRPMAQQWHMIVVITVLQKAMIVRLHAGGSRWRSVRTWALAFLISPCSVNTALGRALKLLMLKVAEFEASWLHLYVGFDALSWAQTHLALWVLRFPS